MEGENENTRYTLADRIGVGGNIMKERSMQGDV